MSLDFVNGTYAITPERMLHPATAQLWYALTVRPRHERAVAQALDAKCLEDPEGRKELSTSYYYYGYYGKYYKHRTKMNRGA